ncbi:MAG TPA: cytochrome C [Acidobacteriota bacterium]|nr:cytochrome C [Acidobacteriota bacterium]HQF86729.1 cytochrome C [Acidobacteriota bacterium]HQG90019.1 cytochrome C [Acidobacteriota bacterium]HQK86425.1 cytochrome C [Acidobacteriota bacterium]
MDALSILLLTAQTAPVLRDLPLPLPLPAGVLAVILVLAFLAHILFVDLLLGGSLLTLWAELRGRREARYLGLARAVAATVTVNKSLAVVLGVAPLLAINTLYPIFFYPATILTGRLWISLVPILIAAFLLLYLHKYRWEQLSRRPALRLGVLGLAVALLLLVPLVFLTNVNLMLFPQRWGSVGGFWSAALLPNVLPRYLHFVCATLAVTGLFLAGWMRRPAYPAAERVSGFTRPDLLRLGYRLALFASLAQLALGPLNFFTLPWHGVTWELAGIFTAGLLFALAAMHQLGRELRAEDAAVGRRFWTVIALLSVTVLFMGWGRHTYRENALAPHRARMVQPIGQPVQLDLSIADRRP